jgi:PAS domain S-box-containing protein
MNGQKALSTRNAQRVVIFAVLLIMIGFFVSEALTQPQGIYSFRFNPFSLLSFAGPLTSLYLLWVLRKSDIKTPETTWFILILIGSFCVGTFEGLARSAITLEGSIYWFDFIAIGVGLEPLGVFLFALFYTNPRKPHFGTTSLVILGALFMSYISSVGAFIFHEDAAHAFLTPWGWLTDPKLGYGANFLWTMALALAGLYLIWKFMRRTTNVVLHKQAKVFVIALSIPIFGAIFTDLIAPSLKLPIPTMHVFFMAVMNCILLYGLKRYKFFRVSPSMVAEGILSTMSEAIIVVTPDLRVELINTASLQIFGKAFESSIDHKVTDYFSPAEAQRIQAEVASSWAEGEIKVIDNLTIDSAGDKKYLQITASEVSEEFGTEGYILAVTDVTELKHSYLALEEEKAGVERVVEERTKELREAKDKLLETDKMKTEFVMLTSHNLRTPFTIVKGNVDMLGTMELKEEERTKIFEDIQTNIGTLGELIEDLLTISTIEAGTKLIHEEVSAEQLLRPLFEAAQKMAKTKHNQVKLETPSSEDLAKQHLRVNEKLLRTSIRNIIDNACKFTTDGTVTITVGFDHNAMKLQIKDTGVGITADELPKLFTKFHRGTDTLQYDYTGEGIGLYLSKLTVEEHDGTIKVESEPGKGTTVTITLPLANNA